MLYKIGDHIQDKYVLINISITESKRRNDSIKLILGMAATTLQLRRLSKQSCIWKGEGGGVKTIRLYGKHL